ncbi:MAG: Nif3-like dinuclear metal center hexameric protein [Bacteroidetes bacterium]|nr:Nif3-like dinuclear metal center hexameric protein [Bacteroidota bacterium]
MKIESLISILEDYAPIPLQESYDNSGLIIGHPQDEVKNALICLDVTEGVLKEAIDKGFELIISHHPLIFKGINKINRKNSVERIIVDAIKYNIAVYAMHTNVDNIIQGVNGTIAQKLGLTNISVLDTKKDLFRKIVTFCPHNYAEKVRNALFEAGSGQIGDYDSCSFNSEGTGTFKGNDETNPFVGAKNELHYEAEIRIETIYPFHKEQKIIDALLSSHPYEKVAFDIFKLENQYQEFGSGIVGELKTELDEVVFLDQLKNIFNIHTIRHSKLLDKPIKRVAVCGGAGSFLIKKAISSGADIFITGDIKYHDFFEAEDKLIIADIGHYESEQFTKELIHTILIEKIPNFALQISGLNTNPINYF